MATAPPPKGDYIARSARRHGVPEKLLRSIAHVESKGKESAVSPKGAKGEFQIMPATARELGYAPEQMHDKEYGAEAGARQLRRMRDRTGSWEDAVAAYNAGAARVAYRKKRGIPLPKETRDYVERVRSRLSGKDAEEALGGTE